jgi:hypothetical protein
MSDPATVVESVRATSDADLHNLAEVERQVQIERAIDSGDHDAITAAGFESGFGRDGLGVLPWVEGSLIVCPGSRHSVVHVASYEVRAGELVEVSQRTVTPSNMR